jgi:hypothetical protein
MIKTINRSRKKKQPVNNLVLTQLEKQQDADDMLAAMSVLAYAPESSSADKLKVVDDPTVVSTKWGASKFFFRPSVSFKEEIKERQQSTAMKALEHIDKVVEDRLRSYRGTMPKALSGNIDEVREFFLKEIAPLTLASSAGTSQAKDVIQRLLGTPVDDTVIAKFDRMTHAAVNIAMARFIAKFFKLPPASRELLLAELKPKQQLPTIIPIPTKANNEQAN